MKSLILLTVLFTSSFANGQSSITFRIELLKPHGFRAMTANFIGVESITFHANVNQNISDDAAGQYSGNFLLNNDDKWIYENHDAILNKGDTLYYYGIMITELAELDGFGKYIVN